MNRSITQAKRRESWLMDEVDEVAARIDRLEADRDRWTRRDIGQLSAIYCFALDERDVEALPTVFDRDAELKSEDGVFEARGVDAIVQTAPHELGTVLVATPGARRADRSTLPCRTPRRKEEDE